MIGDESHSEDSHHSSDREIEQQDQARDVRVSSLKPEEQSLINRFTNQVVDEDRSEDSHATDLENEAEQVDHDHETEQVDHDHEEEQADHDHREDEEATTLKPEESSLITRFRDLVE